MRRAKSRRRGAVDHRMRLRSQAIEVCVDESPRLLMTSAPNCGYTHVPRIRCIWLDWLSSCPELLATHLELKRLRQLLMQPCLHDVGSDSDQHFAVERRPAECLPDA